MFKSFYIKPLFYYLIGLSVVLFVLAFSWPKLFILAKISLLIIFIIAFLDAYILNKQKNKIHCTRQVLEKLSLGDDQQVKYTIENQSDLNLDVALFDELPFQFQYRKKITNNLIHAQEEIEDIFFIRPTERGVYNFGRLHCYISNPKIGLIQKRITINSPFTVEVHPSIIQMRKYELQVFSKTASLSGIRKVRKIGENDEFEHIRSYIQGDNIKSLNWKATSRKNQLMINQFQNSRSQMVYCIIDKGRSMKMPFYGLTLLDHAINSALVISNIILKKYDKVGLITFSDRIGAVVNAKATKNQLEYISRKLYDQKTGFKESNIELLFHTIRKQITRRSILLFFTNFEQTYDLNRNLSYLRSIAKKHLLIVILFQNTELVETSQMECEKKSDIYLKTFANRMLVEKKEIERKMNINGIQTILTKPEDLSINVINKYLEIKSKRMF